MSKKQRLLNAVKTLNLTLEQRQELVEAIDDLSGGESNKTDILEVEHGHYQDYNHYYVIINGTKLISDTGFDYEWEFKTTKENFIKLFNVDSLENLSEYARLKNIKFKIDDGSYDITVGPLKFESFETGSADIGIISYSSLIRFTETLGADEITFIVNRDV